MPFKNRQDQRDANRRSHFKHRYGLTLEQVNELLAEGCAVCGTHKNLHVDHDHETGKVRGCLCVNHNTALGMVHDSIDELLAMIQYLRERA